MDTVVLKESVFVVCVENEFGEELYYGGPRPDNRLYTNVTDAMKFYSLDFAEHARDSLEWVDADRVCIRKLNISYRLSEPLFKPGSVDKK